jgi:hypothetical protein
MSWRLLAVLTLALALALALPGLARAADFVVIRSSVDALAEGQTLSQGAEVRVPAGAEVVLIAQAGDLLRLNGPYEGRLQTGAAAERGSGAVGVLADLFDRKPMDESDFGGIRRGTRSDTRSVQLDLLRQDRWCLIDGAGPELRLPARSYARTLKLAAPSGHSVQVTWPANTDTLAWPAGLALRTGAPYQVVLERAPIGSFRLLGMPAGLQGPIERSVWLARQGCDAQALALLTRTAAQRRQR